MIYLSCDDVLFLSVLPVKLGDSFDCKVIAFCCATSKYDLFRGGSDQLSNLFSCVLASLLCVPTKGVGPRVRVTETIRQIGEHSIQNSKMLIRLKYLGSKAVVAWLSK
jgi:hypothetical protein